MKNLKVCFLGLLGFVPFVGFGQVVLTNPGSTFQLNTITTAVPFLQIVTEGRSAGLGDIGVTLKDDANSMFRNFSQTVFGSDKFQVAASYTPWLRELVDDINLYAGSGYFRLKNNQVIGASFQYFTLGEINFTNAQGTIIGSAQPREWAFALGYARQLAERWSIGLNAKYILSDITNGYTVAGGSTQPGTSIASDLSLTYKNRDVKIGEKAAVFSFGMNISNIGSKMSYTQSGTADFIPSNLKLGPGTQFILSEKNSVYIGIDFNKLLVPTSPLYLMDSTGQAVHDPSTGDPIILAGRNPNVGVAQGIFQSFGDAPGIVVRDEAGSPITNADGSAQIESGSRFREELNEITIGYGLEFLHGKKGQIALRSGYFYEAATKGNRKYLTFGGGLHLRKATVDFSMLIPQKANHPMSNTFRLTARFGLETFQLGNL